MKRPTTLLSRVLLDVGLQTSVAVDKDVLEIERRVKDEGMSFLTITLPSLCDALDQGLAQGFIAPAHFPGFKPWKRGGKLPALLSGFFMNIFDRDGALLVTPCIASIDAVRQVTRLFKKVELPCSAARSSRAYERYITNDAQCLEETREDRIYDQVSALLWHSLDSRVPALFCRPGVFGSGATAERLMLNERWDVRRWPTRGNETFPVSAFCTHREDLTEVYDRIQFLTVEEEQPVRVVQVPKTLKTPRIISVEPSYMMLRQQSVMRFLVEYLEGREFPHNSIRFTDQSVNQDRARVGSIDGQLSTIDLSDASDLVSLELVKRTFRSCPEFLEFLLDSRTTKAQLPGGEVLNLRKFASMGSALCFPVEAMVFFTVVLTAMLKASGKCPSSTQLRKLSAKVCVYGDDIIVPTQTAAGVMCELEAFGLRVNMSKSYSTGLFRESCGGDFYAGHDVTPAYCRMWDFTGYSKDSRVITAYISLSNQFYLKGLWNASQFIRDHLTELVGVLSRTTSPVGGLTLCSCAFNTQLRWDRHLQGFSARGITLRTKTQPDRFRTLDSFLLRTLSGQYAGIGEEIRGQSALGSVVGVNTTPREMGGVHCTCVRGNTAYSGDHSGSIEPGDRGSCVCAAGVRGTTPFSLQFSEVSSENLWGNPCGLSRFNRSDFVRRESSKSMEDLFDGRSRGLETEVSIVPYATNTKRRWTPTKVGIPGW